MTSRITPIKNNVLVELSKLPDKTESGLAIVHLSEGEEMREYTSSPTFYGEVKSIGPKVVDIKVGNHITFLKANCWRFGKKGVLISEDSVMAIL